MVKAQELIRNICRTIYGQSKPTVSQSIIVSVDMKLTSCARRPIFVLSVVCIFYEGSKMIRITKYQSV